MARTFLIFIMTITLTTSLFADVLSSILESKKIRVCIWPEYYGISYIDPRTQELIGIDIDLAKEFAKELGVNVAFKESSFASLIKDITTKNCDIAMFAIGHTEERKKHLSLTTPHLASDVYAISSKSNRRINVWEDIDKAGISQFFMNVIHFKKHFLIIDNFLTIKIMFFPLQFKFELFYQRRIFLCRLT